MLLTPQTIDIIESIDGIERIKTIFTCHAHNHNSHEA